jgi:Raf kinase inhibitor-like YbhB/YbcL family protein
MIFKRGVVILLALIILTGCQLTTEQPDGTIKTKNMKIMSNDFKHNQSMDPKFTCDGQNLQPQLQWDEVTEGTKSLALSCLDADTPAGEWAHWLVINIPADAREVTQGGGAPAGANEIKNDFNYGRYGGPCPPSGTHRYIFSVYALDTERLEGVNRQNFKQKVAEHAIDSAEIIGLYQRQ